MCRKVLRYILATRDQGILLRRSAGPPRGDGSAPPEGPERLTVWTDAGYGGVGTKAQTGVLISWDDAVVLARSSKQATPALSTCEAEVAAAATGYVCVAGLQCLLEEWGIVLQPPLLLIDNKSAITVCGMGGTWRTRYFAVRAARIAYEHSLNNVELRYCKTDQMAADALTKAASSTVMDKMREVLDGIMPSLMDMPKVELTDPSWWGASLRYWRVSMARATEEHYQGGCSAHLGCHPAQVGGETRPPAMEIPAAIVLNDKYPDPAIDLLNNSNVNKLD